MIKYKVEISGWSRRPVIEAVEIDRETDKSVWIRGSRREKISQYFSYHDSFGEAKEALLFNAEERLELAKIRVQRADEYLQRAKKLTEDESATQSD